MVKRSLYKDSVSVGSKMNLKNIEFNYSISQIYFKEWDFSLVCTQ